MPRKQHLKKVKRIVVKIGSSTITEQCIISSRMIFNIVSDISDLIGRGYEVVIVSSGAIAAGAGSLNRNVESLSIPEKQALASVGQTILMNEYREMFNSHGIEVGQILLTEDDVKNRRRYLNARHTLEELLRMNIVPIVNENDSVVVKEIKFGDNDLLSSHVTGLINANLLILLSDVDGFFLNLDDPEPVEEVREITDIIIDRAGGAGSRYGTGGMLSKIRAAQTIIRFGEMMIIANGKVENILRRIISGEAVGTIFIGGGKQLSSRKKWLALQSATGTVVIDPGAILAVKDKKKSLLASGIIDVHGTFDMGDIVDICESNKVSIGKGIVNYSSNELAQIKGKKSQEIRNILGGNYFDEVINRNDLIIL